MLIPNATILSAWGHKALARPGCDRGGVDDDVRACTDWRGSFACWGLGL